MHYLDIWQELHGYTHSFLQRVLNNVFCENLQSAKIALYELGTYQNQHKNIIFARIILSSTMQIFLYFFKTALFLGPSVDYMTKMLSI